VRHTVATIVLAAVIVYAGVLIATKSEVAVMDIDMVKSMLKKKQTILSA
jgi:hypothetical protein